MVSRLLSGQPALDDGANVREGEPDRCAFLGVVRVCGYRALSVAGDDRSGGLGHGELEPPYKVDGDVDEAKWNQGNVRGRRRCQPPQCPVLQPGVNPPTNRGWKGGAGVELVGDECEQFGGLSAPALGLLATCKTGQSVRVTVSRGGSHSPRHFRISSGVRGDAVLAGHLREADVQSESQFSEGWRQSWTFVLHGQGVLDGGYGGWMPRMQRIPLLVYIR